jgi:hypothetical protein
VGPALAIAAGGVLAIAGAALSWFKLTVQLPLGQLNRTQTVNGLDLRSGKVVLAAGIVAILVGAAIFLVRERIGRMVLAIIGLMAGAAAFGLSLHQVVTEKARAVAERVALAPIDQQERVRQVLRRLLATGAIRISLRAGLVIALVGGAVAALGAIVALVGSAGGSPAYPESPS